MSNHDVCVRVRVCMDVPGTISVVLSSAVQGGHELALLKRQYVGEAAQGAEDVPRAALFQGRGRYDQMWMRQEVSGGKDPEEPKPSSGPICIWEDRSALGAPMWSSETEFAWDRRRTTTSNNNLCA